MSTRKKFLLAGSVVLVLLLFVFVMMSCSDDGWEENETEDESGFSDDDEFVTEITTVHEHKPYTFMVFLNGTDLESEGEAATSDLMEMAAVGSNEHVNVVVETGGTYQWSNDFVDSSQNQRWLVEQEDFTHLVDLGNRNIGDPRVLKDFIVWTTKSFPADKYVLVFWNHGGGSVAGYGVDELNNWDSLTLDEIEWALAKAHEETEEYLEVIGFDACLMSTLETAYMAAPYANYLVASEELEPGHGWNYTPILEAISMDPAITGDQLGRVIADGFIEQGREWGDDSFITLAVTDLSKIGEVVEAFEGLLSRLSQLISRPEGIRAVSLGRGKAEYYGGATEQEGITDMVDIADFARHLGAEHEDQANALIAAIKEAVVYKVNGPTRQNSNGLSVYFPYMDKENFAYNLAQYTKLNFSPIYKEFLSGYTAGLTGKTTNVALAADTERLEDGTFQIIIAESDRDDIEHIYCVLGMYVDENEDLVLDLGMDNDLEYDPDTGVVTDNFTGWWVALNGHFVSLYITEETDDYNLYSIPVLLNGEEVNIRAAWFWDDQYEEGGYYEVYDAWKGIDENTNMADRKTIEIKPGDSIAPIFRYHSESTGETGYSNGEAFIVEEELKLDFIELPPRDYLYGFYITDYAQNEMYSEFIIFELID